MRHCCCLSPLLAAASPAPRCLAMALPCVGRGSECNSKQAARSGRQPRSRPRSRARAASSSPPMQQPRSPPPPQPADQSKSQPHTCMQTHSVRRRLNHYEYGEVPALHVLLYRYTVVLVASQLATYRGTSIPLQPYRTVPVQPPRTILYSPYMYC